MPDTTTLPPDVQAYIDRLNRDLRGHQTVAARLVAAVVSSDPTGDVRSAAFRLAARAGYDVHSVRCACGTRFVVGTLRNDGAAPCPACGTEIRVVLGKIVRPTNPDTAP